MTADPTVAPVLLTAPLGPDRLVGMGPIEVDDSGLVRASMPTARWMVGPDGRPSAGALGVLLDAVLGQAMLLPRPVDGWAVTTELAADLVAPVPLDGSPVTVEARAVAADAEGSLSQGRVLAADGTLLGVATEWGKFTPGVPDVDAVVPVVRVPEAGSVVGLLGGEVSGDPVTLSVPGVAALANELDTIHGGIMLTASEVAAAAALPGPPDRPLVTGSMRICYLRPSPVAGTTQFRTRVVHAGRSFGVVEVEAWGPTGKLATTATVTRRVR